MNRGQHGRPQQSFHLQGVALSSGTNEPRPLA